LRERSLHPTRFAVAHAAAVGLEKPLHQLLTLRAAATKTVGSDLDAGHEAYDVESEWRQASVVKIVDIEITQAIVSFEGAEIFQVQIAAGQNAGCAEQAVSAGQKLEKQRIGAAKEGECVLAEQCQF
jgi:regulator of protease activity HflC (stomatin/prohibitin superfamily)